LKGVLIAAIVSLALLIKRVATPNVAVLGQIPGTSKFSDIKRHADNVELPGIKILRIESSILYFNEQHISEQIRSIVSNTAGIHLLVLDLSNVSIVDVSGSEMLLELCGHFSEKEINVRIVEAHSEVRDLLRQQGIEDLVGHVSRKLDINDVVNHS
jgi:anti-anti-sigma factor